MGHAWLHGGQLTCEIACPDRVTQRCSSTLECTRAVIHRRKSSVMVNKRRNMPLSMLTSQRGAVVGKAKKRAT